MGVAIVRFGLLLVAAWSQVAAAEEGAEPQRSSDDIIVTATGRSAAVSTTKSAQAIIEAPQTISIISKEELDLRPSPNLTDALAYTAGVQVSTLGTDILYTLIQTARLNDADPQAWLADVLARIADHPVSRLDELLPWNWRPSAPAIAA